MLKSTGPAGLALWRSPVLAPTPGVLVDIAFSGDVFVGLRGLNLCHGAAESTILVGNDPNGGPAPSWQWRPPIWEAILRGFAPVVFRSGGKGPQVGCVCR